MSLLLILLGVVLAGVLVDFLVENDVINAATQPLTMAGTTVRLSTPMVAAVAFALGALAVLLIFAGIRRSRRKHRKTLEDRMELLEQENARLHTQRNLPNVVRIPDSEEVVRVPDPEEAAQTPEPTAVPAGATPPPAAETAPQTKTRAFPQPADESSGPRW